MEGLNGDFELDDMEEVEVDIKVTRDAVVWKQQLMKGKGKV